MQQVALVTGGSKGLGKGFVDYLLDSDFVVYSGVRNITEQSSVSNPNLRIIELDVTNDSQISKAVARIEGEMGYLSYLINNAGVNKDTATNNHKKLEKQPPLCV
jgi:NAD(P)-dependent dehydrogenase (short-subunit alcohol dehydrogenase family)